MFHPRKYDLIRDYIKILSDDQYWMHVFSDLIKYGLILGFSSSSMDKNNILTSFTSSMKYSKEVEDKIINSKSRFFSEKSMIRAVMVSLFLAHHSGITLNTNLIIRYGEGNLYEILKYFCLESIQTQIIEKYNKNSKSLMMIIDSCIPYSVTLESINKMPVKSIPMMIPPLANILKKKPRVTTPTYDYNDYNDDYTESYYYDYEFADDLSD